MTVTALLVAAGRGARAQTAGPKQWHSLGGKRVIDWTIRQFATHPEVHAICLVVHPDDVSQVQEAYDYCIGGATRAASVAKGLAHIQHHAPEIVLIHDAVRPFIQHSTISQVIASARQNGAAAPGVPMSDTLWRAKNASVSEIVPRDALYRAQTPQGFDFALIRVTLAQSGRESATDDVALALKSGHQVIIVQGDDENFKLTYPTDFERAEIKLRQGWM